MPKLYAVLVGLDVYPPPVRSLQGCKNDANAMKSYLENRFPKDQLSIKTLFDKDATRLNILQTIEGHLGQAGKDDIALFYYAGHGSQEPANEAFWMIEPDKKNETLVCYDSRVEDGMDLADKELITTIDCVAEKCENVVVIIDACHSGGIMRDVDNETETRGCDEDTRADAANYRPRPLSSYCLRTTSSTEARAVLTGESKLVIPNPRHVTFSGSLPTQTSKETTFGGLRRGVFTFSLIKTLEENPYPMTYAELLSRVRALVVNKANDQIPQLDLENQTDANKIFLGQNKLNQNLGYLLYHDTKNVGGWVINAGELLGISLGAVLSVYQSDVQDIRDKSKYAGRVKVMSTTGATAIVQPMDFNLDTTKMYKAILNTPNARPTNFFVQSDNPAYTQKLLLAIKNSPTAAAYLKIVQQAEAAEYVTYCLQNNITIGRKLEGVGANGMPAAPLTVQLKGYTDENITKTVENMERIARWQSALDLGNPKSQIDSSQISLVVNQEKEDGTRIPINLQTQKNPRTGRLELTPISVSYKDDNVLPRIRLQVKNNSSQAYFVSLLAFSSQFGILNILKEQSYLLQPGDEVWSKRGSMFVPKELRAMGKNTVTEQYKLFVSTDQFNIQTLLQDELGLPMPSFRGGDEKAAAGLDKLLESVDTRGGMYDDEDSAPSYDWTSMLTQIRVVFNGTIL